MDIRRGSSQWSDGLCFVLRIKNTPFNEWIKATPYDALFCWAKYIKPTRKCRWNWTRGRTARYN